MKIIPERGVRGRGNVVSFRILHVWVVWNVSRVMNCPLSGRGQGHVTPFYILRPGHIFVADKARYSKFGTLTDRNEWIPPSAKIPQFMMYGWVA